MNVTSQSASPRRRAFTLVELIVAMGTFSILMLAMLQFFGNAQTIWKNSDAGTRIYENARIAFEMINRDLQCAVAGKRTGEEIPFTITSASEIAFVAAAPAASGAKSDLCEIGYRWDATRYQLQRARISDSTGSWNFWGKNDGSWAADMTSLYEVVADGVAGVSFACQDVTTTGTTLMPYGTTQQLPQAVTVTLTLIDERLVTGSSPAAQKKTQRTFTRTFFIGSRN